MKLKLRRIGGSVGVIIPRSVLQEMHVDEGDELELTPLGERTYLMTAPSPRTVGALAKIARSSDSHVQPTYPGQEVLDELRADR